MKIVSILVSSKQSFGTQQARLAVVLIKDIFPLKSRSFIRKKRTFYSLEDTS